MSRWSTSTRTCTTSITGTSMRQAIPLQSRIRIGTATRRCSTAIRTSQTSITSIRTVVQSKGLPERQRPLCD